MKAESSMSLGENGASRSNGKLTTKSQPQFIWKEVSIIDENVALDILHMGPIGSAIAIYSQVPTRDSFFDDPLPWDPGYRIFKRAGYIAMQYKASFRHCDLWHEYGYKRPGLTEEGTSPYEKLTGDLHLACIYDDRECS